MEQVLAHPEKLKLGGERKELTVLFSDIRGFTTLSERMTPEQLVSFINQYLTPMTDIVFANGGTLDKYIGDAIMAFWGAPVDQPDHALRACRAALGFAGEAGRAARGPLARRRPARGGHRRGHQQRAHERGPHGHREPLQLHGDGRRGEPRLPPRGPQQGVRHPHPHLRRHLRPGAGPRHRPPPRRGACQGQAEPSPTFTSCAPWGRLSGPDAEAIEAFEAGVARFLARDFADAEDSLPAGAGRSGPSDEPSRRYLDELNTLTLEPARARLGRGVHRDHEVGTARTS